jgi:hypothetical protein
MFVRIMAYTFTQLLFRVKIFPAPPSRARARLRSDYHPHECQASQRDQSHLAVVPVLAFLPATQAVRPSLWVQSRPGRSRLNRERPGGRRAKAASIRRRCRSGPDPTFAHFRIFSHRRSKKTLPQPRRAPISDRLYTVSLFPDPAKAPAPCAALAILVIGTEDFQRGAAPTGPGAPRLVAFRSRARPARPGMRPWLAHERRGRPMRVAAPLRRN